MVLHAHYIHVIVYMTLFHLSVLLLSLVSYLSVYITVRFMIHWFQCSTYIALYFHISILLFPLLVCALTGPLLTDLDFSAAELEETDEPLFEGTQEDYQAWVRSFLFLCILAFCLVIMTRCQNCIFCFFVFVIFLILYPDNSYCIDVCLVCENETSVCLLYLCVRT